MIRPVHLNALGLTSLCAALVLNVVPSDRSRDLTPLSEDRIGSLRGADGITQPNYYMDCNQVQYYQMNSSIYTNGDTCNPIDVQEGKMCYNCATVGTNVQTFTYTEPNHPPGLYENDPAHSCGRLWTGFCGYDTNGNLACTAMNQTLQNCTTIREWFVQ